MLYDSDEAIPRRGAAVHQPGADQRAEAGVPQGRAAGGGGDELLVTGPGRSVPRVRADPQALQR